MDKNDKKIHTKVLEIDSEFVMYHVAGRRGSNPLSFALALKNSSLFFMSFQ